MKSAKNELQEQLLVTEPFFDFFLYYLPEFNGIGPLKGVTSLEGEQNKKHGHYIKTKESGPICLDPSE